MSVARDPNGNECCLKVDAAGSLLTFTGTMLAAGVEALPAGVMYGEMRRFGVDPGPPWVRADGRSVVAHGKQQKLPTLEYVYVCLP